MRVTSSMYYDNLYGTNNSKLSKKLFDVNKQIASGLKIQYASDDVTTFAQTMRLDNELTVLGQVKKSTQSASKVSNQTDVVMNEFTDTLNRMRVLFINASNASSSEASRDAISGELRGLEEHLKNLANTSINGQFLFSGSDVDTRPISDNGIYQGNDKSLKAFLGSNIQQQYNIPGSELFLGEENRTNREITSNVRNNSLTAEFPDFTDTTVKGTENSAITTSSTIRDLMGDIDNTSGTTINHFYLRGVKHDGTAFSTDIKMNQENTVAELLKSIGDAYGNTLNANVVNVNLNQFGQIVVEDKIKGSSKLDFHMVGAVDFSNKIPVDNQIQTKIIDTPPQLNTITFTDTTPSDLDTISVDVNGQTFISDPRDGANTALTDMSDLVTNLIAKINAFDFGNGAGNTFTLVDTTNATNTSSGSFTIEAKVAGTPFTVANLAATSATFVNDPTVPNIPLTGQVYDITVDPTAAFDIGDTYTVDVDGIGAVAYEVKLGDGVKEVAAGLVATINSSPLAATATATDNGDGTYSLSEVVASPGDPAVGFTTTLGGFNSSTIPSNNQVQTENIDTAFVPGTPGTGEVNTITVDPNAAFTVGSAYSVNINGIGKVSYIVQAGDTSIEVATGLTTAINSGDLSAEVNAVDNLDGTYTLTEKVAVGDPAKGLNIEFSGTVPSSAGTDLADVNSYMYVNSGSINNLDFGETNFKKILNGTSTAKNQNLYVKEFVKSPYAAAQTSTGVLESASFAMDRAVFGDGTNDDSLSISINNGDGTTSSYSQKFVTDAATTYEALKTKIENDNNFTVGISGDTITLNTTFIGLSNNVSINVPLANDNGSLTTSVSVTSTEKTIDIPRSIDALLYDNTQFTKAGSRLTSDVPQVLKSTNAFATPSTKLSEVADLSQGNAATLDGTTFKLVGKNISGVSYNAQIDLKNTLNGGSTFSLDGGTTNLSIFDMSDPRVAVNADDMTYQQLMDVINMVVTEQIPIVDTAEEYDNKIVSSKGAGNTTLSYDGKITFEQLNTSDTKARISLYDSNSGNFASDPSVMSFNSNNALTVRDPKTDFFKSINEMIQSVEDYKEYPDASNGVQRGVGIENAIQMMDDMFEHVNRSHSIVGAQSNSLTRSLERTELLEISTMTLRSSTIDTDLAEASLNLTQLTLNYQAMLSTVGKVSQLSLVNYL